MCGASTVTVSDVLDFIVRWGAVLGIPGALGWWFKERRKNRVAARVAERTEEADVRSKDAGALVAEVAAIERAFAVERESYARQAAEQERQIRALKTEITVLRAEVAELRAALGLKANKDGSSD